MLALPELLRLVRVLHRLWSRASAAPDAGRMWSDLESVLDEAKRMQRRIRLAARHNLQHTEADLRAELGRRLRDVTAQVAELGDATVPPDPPPDRRHWLGELRQLEAEFGAVTIRWRDRVLRVATEPVVLEGVDLGPFAIEFGWGGRGLRAFDVVALEPNPASGREDTVHPHVEGKRLCAGEAAEPIRTALDEGRLADAFLLVQSVLVNYNPHSAYVPLAEWAGFRCTHCGARGRPGSAGSCDACDADLCGDCSDACAHCSDTRCPGCLESCDRCEDRCCSACLSTVAGQRVCPDCRTTCPSCGTRTVRDDPDDDRCPACIRAATEESHEPEPEEAACVPTV